LQHRSTLLHSNFVKFGRYGEFGEIMRYLPDTKYKISPAFHTVATAQIAPKVCQGQPQHFTQSAPDFTQIGSLSATL